MMPTGTRILGAAMIAVAASVIGAATAHAASTLTATPTPFASTEQVDFIKGFIGGCYVLPPPVIQGCTAPQADCSFFGMNVARFQSSRANASGDQFSVSASYSDGFSGGGIVEGSAGGFTALAEHPAFPEPASVTATVTITDTVDGSSATVTTPISITERVIRADGCQDRAETVGKPFTGLPVAIVLDSEQGTPDVRADISWGDGTTSSGVWQPTSQSPYADLIDGAHTYAAPGRYAVTVTMVEPDDSASQVAVSTVVAVSSAVPIPATGAGSSPAAGGALLVIGLSLITASVSAGCFRRLRGC
jgi:hypothetical protein